MAEVGYNLQSSASNEYLSSSQTFSLAKSRAFTLNAGDVFNAFHLYSNSNQGSNATISFWLYTADGNGEAVDYVGGPYTLNIPDLDNSYAVRSVTGLSVNIPSTGDYTILANNDKGFRIARGASAESMSKSSTPPADPFVESSTETWDVAVWGEYTAGSANELTDDGQSGLKGKTVTHDVTPNAATGTIYYIVGLASANTTAPSAAQIAAGLNQDTTAATYDTNVAPADTNGETFVATGLPTGTAMKAYAVWDMDDAGDYSNVIEWTFTTDNVGLSMTMRDRTNSNALLTTGTFNIVGYDVQGGTELFDLDGLSPDGSGIVEIDNDAVGDTGDTIHLDVEHSSGVAQRGPETVVNLG